MPEPWALIKEARELVRGNRWDAGLLIQIADALDAAQAHIAQLEALLRDIRMFAAHDGNARIVAHLDITLRGEEAAP